MADTGTVQVHVIVHPEPGGWFATIPEFDVTSQGDSEDKAIANVRDALELLIEVADEDEIQRRRGNVRLLVVA